MNYHRQAFSYRFFRSCQESMESIHQLQRYQSEKHLHSKENFILWLARCAELCTFLVYRALAMYTALVHYLHWPFVHSSSSTTSLCLHAYAPFDISLHFSSRTFLSFPLPLQSTQSVPSIISSIPMASISHLNQPATHHPSPIISSCLTSGPISHFSHVSQHSHVLHFPHPSIPLFIFPFSASL